MTKLLVKWFVKNSSDTNDEKVRGAYGAVASIVGIISNVLLCAGKFLVGTLFGSVAIAADAVNNLADASASIITLVGFKLSEKPADAEHPFGHARIEYLSALSIALMILVIGVELLKTSVSKIFTPEAVTFSYISVGVLVASIIVKIWLAKFNSIIGKRINSKSIIAVAADSKNDVIATSGVLLASVAERITGWQLDGYMGFLVAVFILYSGFGIVKETLSPILGEAPDTELVQNLCSEILAGDGILGMHDLMVHDYGPGRRFASAHAEMSADADVMESHDVIDDIERRVKEKFAVHLVLHFDPINTNDETIKFHRELIVQIVKEFDENLTIHDFRMVKGPGHTNLIFDVVLPVKYHMSDEAVKEQLVTAVKTNDEKHYPIITVDHNFI